jgi:pantetheine-phosphate adenylyltransferase
MADAVAIYPGSFDPLTNGHFDVIARGHRVFPRLIVAVVGNPQKAPLFTPEERVVMIREAVVTLPGVEVDHFSGLLVEYARAKRAKVILRGLRMVSDFENEFQMANMNRKLASEIETFFMMTGEGNFYVSSQTIKEVARLRGSVSGLVPPNVEKALLERFGGGPG